MTRFLLGTFAVALVLAAAGAVQAGSTLLPSISLMASPAAADAQADGSAACAFPQGTWVTPTYLSGTVFSSDHLYELHAGLGYYLWDNLAFNVEGVGTFVDFGKQAGNPGDAWGAGLDLLFRWHFLQGQNWTVYADAGAGFREFNRQFPTNGTHFDFTPQAGLGATVHLASYLDLMGGARYFHLSNAGYDGTEHNPGYNGMQVYMGVLLTW